MTSRMLVVGVGSMVAMAAQSAMTLGLVAALTACGASAHPPQPLPPPAAAGGAIAGRTEGPRTGDAALLAAGSAAPAGATEAKVSARPLGPPPRLRLSEVMTDPLLLDDVAGEYIEIVNVDARPVTVTDLALALPSGRVVRLQRAGAAALAPCAALVVRAHAESPDEATVAKLRLPNRAGRIQLLHRDRLVDQALWTGRWPWPRHRAGRALERVNGDASGDRGSSWRHARAALRRVERGSPGRHGLACALGAEPAAAADAATLPPGADAGAAALATALTPGSAATRPRGRP